MPWCPQCKTEYQEGYTVCSDCKVPLVEKLDELEDEICYEPFFQSEDQKTAEKLASFFEYSGLPSEVSFDEEYQLYIVSIPPGAEKDARKLYEAFYIVEAERSIKDMQKKASEQVISDENSEDESEQDLEANADSEEYYDREESDQSEKEVDEGDLEPADEASPFHSSSSVYIMKSDQYKDLSQTVWIFLLFGVVGLIIVTLNITKVLTFLNGWLPNLVMAALFLFFIIIALTTNNKAKKVRSEIDAENLMTRDINKWLKENVTEDYLASIHNDSISEEANYIRSTDYIKEALIKEFGQQNLAYLDRVIEEFYSATFYKDEM